MQNNTRLGLITAGLLLITGSAHALATATVPEPSSLGLLSLALVIAGLVGRKK